MEIEMFERFLEYFEFWLAPFFVFIYIFFVLIFANAVQCMYNEYLKTKSLKKELKDNENIK